MFCPIHHRPPPPPAGGEMDRRTDTQSFARRQSVTVGDVDMSGQAGDVSVPCAGAAAVDVRRGGGDAALGSNALLEPRPRAAGLHVTPWGWPFGSPVCSGLGSGVPGFSGYPTCRGPVRPSHLVWIGSWFEGRLVCSHTAVSVSPLGRTMGRVVLFGSKYVAL